MRKRRQDDPLVVCGGGGRAGRGGLGGGATGSSQCWSDGQPVHSSLLSTMAYGKCRGSTAGKVLQCVKNTYISTNSPAIMHAAQTLGSFDFGEPEVEDAVAEEELDLSDFVMEEDAEMCAAAGIPVSGPSTLPNSVDIQHFSQMLVINEFYYEFHALFFLSSMCLYF